MLKSEHHQGREGISAHQLWTIRKCIIDCAYKRQREQEERHQCTKLLRCKGDHASTQKGMENYILYLFIFIKWSVVISWFIYWISRLSLTTKNTENQHGVFMPSYNLSIFYSFPLLMVCFFVFDFDFVFLCVANTFGMDDDCRYYYHFWYTIFAIATKCAVNSM